MPIRPSVVSHDHVGNPCDKSFPDKWKYFGERKMVWLSNHMPPEGGDPSTGAIIFSTVLRYGPELKTFQIYVLYMYIWSQVQECHKGHLYCPKSIVC